jgi:hypothetical protein
MNAPMTTTRRAARALAVVSALVALTPPPLAQGAPTPPAVVKQLLEFIRATPIACPHPDGRTHCARYPRGAAAFQQDVSDFFSRVTPALKVSGWEDAAATYQVRRDGWVVTTAFRAEGVGGVIGVQAFPPVQVPVPGRGAN